MGDTGWTFCECLHTIELGLGEDAATEAESVLPVADIEG